MRVELIGDHTLVTCQLGDATLTVKADKSAHYEMDEPIGITFRGLRPSSSSIRRRASASADRMGMQPLRTNSSTAAFQCGFRITQRGMYRTLRRERSSSARLKQSGRGEAQGRRYARPGAARKVHPPYTRAVRILMLTGQRVEEIARLPDRPRRSHRV